MSEPVVDAGVHPLPARPDDLLEYLPTAYRTRPLPGVHRYLYPAPTGEPPFGEYLAATRGGAALPASDPSTVSRHLASQGIDRAVLLPLTRGIVPDVELGSLICAATNDWLVDVWLGNGAASPFRGSIRINPHDPEGAVREIERLGDHPMMVQVAVPLEAHSPYGQRHYRRIWEAAATYELPVAIHSDGGCGVDLPPTPNGYPRSYIEYLVLMPLNFIYHLSSFIAEGVFERIPGLRVVFADGGHDMLHPLMWRMNEDWAPTRMEIPWVRRLFSDYLPEHVRMFTSGLEGPIDPMIWPDWFQRTDGDRLLMFASNYPHWSATDPTSAVAGLDEAARRRVLCENARDLYRRLG